MLRWLKHGTSETPPKVIWASPTGIDAIDNGQPGMFGKAVYCAESMEYSHRGYRHDLGNGRAQLLLVKFLAGRVDDRSGQHAAPATARRRGPRPITTAS